MNIRERFFTLRFSRELYPKEAVMKAAYHFIDRCYIHVGLDDSHYLLEIIPKKDFDSQTILLEFENELLAQAVRYQVYKQTHVLREVLMARALSSTITGIDTQLATDEIPEQGESLQEILEDWFEKNEGQ